MAESGVLRNTRQRELVLNCLRDSSGGHVTAEDIVDELKARHTPVAKSTVYRHLAALEESGAVRKYIQADGSHACYQFMEAGGACREHYHLMCRSCGRVVHFESQELEIVLINLRASAGFLVDGFRTVFYGFCRHCITEREAE